MKMTECVFCGCVGKTTRDHVPPKGIFLPPLPTDLVTVPAGARCNGSTALDDEYFRACIATQGYWTPAGARLWKSKVVGSTFKRSAALRKMLAEKIISLPRKARRSDLPGGEKAVLFESDRINRIIRKIVLGLYWHHEGRRLSGSSELEVFKDVPMDEELRQMFGGLTPRSIGSIGDNAFHYRYGVEIGAPDRTLWLLQFYEKTQFMVATNVPKLPR